MHPTAPPSANERRLLAWLLAAAALLCAAMAVPLLSGRVYTADDLGEYHLPLRAFYAGQLTAGQPFDWLPSLFSGFYLTGEGQAGTYHPLHWALYRFLPLSVAFDLELLVSYPLMLAGSYLLLGRWLARRDAALLGAFAFTFSGFNLLHFVHPNAVAVVAHWPWLLWAIDSALLPKKVPKRGHSTFSKGCPVPWAYAIISLVLGSEILIGYPQYVWIGLWVVIPYALVLVAKSPAPRWRPFAALFVAGVAGVLLGGVQLIPSLSALAGSTRPSADAAFVSSGSLHPLNMLQVVAPYVFATRVVGQNTHELGLYFGAVPLLLCAWLLARRRAWGDCRPLIVAALWVGGVALVLAFGEYGIGGGWQRYLPLIGNFRFPCRSIVWLYAAVALLTAIAWQRLVATSAPNREESSVKTFSAPVAVWIASLLVAIVASMIWPDYLAWWVWAVTGPLWFGAGTIALLAAERGYRAAPVALVLLTLLDLGSYGLSYSIWGNNERLERFAQSQDMPPNADRPIVAQPISDVESGPQVGNRLLLAGFRRADGYAGLVPRRRLDYRDPASLRVAGVGFRAENFPGGYDPVNWLPVPDPLPSVRLITRTIKNEGGRLPAEALSADAAMVDTAIGDYDSYADPIQLPAGSPGTLSDLETRPGRLAVRADVPSRQVLAVTESFHFGWQATVDGRPVPIVRVNRDFLGCVVDPGKHDIVLDFQPFSLRLGKVLSTLGLGLLCVQLVVAMWLGRRGIAQQTIAREDAAPHGSPC